MKSSFILTITDTDDGNVEIEGRTPDGKLYHQSMAHRVGQAVQAHIDTMHKTGELSRIQEGGDAEVQKA